MKNKILLIGILINLFILTSYSQSDCSFGTSQAVLNANNIRTTLPIGGSLWWDGDDGLYIYPYQDSSYPYVSALFNGGLLMAGIDETGQKKYAASIYGLASGNGGYWPGPLDINTMSISSEQCNNWDKQFSVSNVSIQDFLDDWEDNGQIDNPIPDEIAQWPAKGNPLFFDHFFFELPDMDLAPFNDRNEDGIYNPLEGDYPAIKNATQAIWWIINDAGGSSEESNSAPIGIEVQVLAYAYDSPIPAINNTTYYDYKIINKSAWVYTNYHIGLWIDADVGCNVDDYAGSIPDKNLAFFYNGDIQDGEIECNCPGGVNTYCEEIPVVGIKILEGPQAPKIFDNEGNLIDAPIGSTPDSLVNLGLSSFLIGYNPTVSSPPNQQPWNVYKALHGLSGDDSPIIVNGEESTFMYPGNPGSNQTDDYTMCDEDTFSGDLRAVMGVGPFRFDKGAIQKFSFAVTISDGMEYPCPDITNLILDTDQISEFHASNLNETISSLEENEEEEKSLVVDLFPNPIVGDSKFTLNDKNDLISTIVIVNSSGQSVFTESKIQQEEYVINESLLEKGIYIYTITTQYGKIYSGKMIK